MKKLISLLLSFVLCITLSGCYDSKEISRIAFVMAIGFDENSYTFQIAKPSAFEGDGSDSSPLLSLTVDAPDVYTAMDRLNSSISEKCDYSHIKIVIFSEEKIKGGIEDEITAMLKSNDFHPNTRVAVCEGKVSEYMSEMEIPLDANPAEFYENIFNSKYTQYAPDTKLKDMQKKYRNHVTGNALPVLNSSSDMAITSGYVLTDFAKQNEALIYNMLKNKSFKGNYPPINDIVLNLKKTYCKFSVDLSDGVPLISVKIKLDATVVWSEREIDKKILSVQAKEKIESDITGFLYKTSTHYKGDVLELYRLAKANYTTVKAWEKEDWQGLFEKANYNVSVEVNIKREGLYIN